MVKTPEPQVATREIPTGCEGVVEQERVQQVAQRDCIISILRDHTAWPSKALTEEPDPSLKLAFALSRRWAKETSRSPFQSKSPYDSMKRCYCKCLAFTCASKSWINPAPTKQVYKKTYLFKNKHYLPIIL